MTTTRTHSEITKVHKIDSGRYTVRAIPDGCNTSEVWNIVKGRDGRWYGECLTSIDIQRAGAVVDAPTLRVAKYDIQNGFTC